MISRLQGKSYDRGKQLVPWENMEEGHLRVSQEMLS